MDVLFFRYLSYFAWILGRNYIRRLLVIKHIRTANAVVQHAASAVHFPYPFTPLFPSRPSIQH